MNWTCSRRQERGVLVRAQYLHTLVYMCVSSSSYLVHEFYCCDHFILYIRPLRLCLV